MPPWSFLSHHGAVLILVATESRITATEIGARLGITERPVRRIISELAAAGYIRRTKEGRRNHYSVDPDLPIPGPVLRDIAVGDLLSILQARADEENGSNDN